MPRLATAHRPSHATAHPGRHTAFASGALIHLGAITIARLAEQKFEIKDPVLRGLTYSGLVAGATYVTKLLRDREREQERATASHAQR